MQESLREGSQGKDPANPPPPPPTEVRPASQGLSSLGDRNVSEQGSLAGEVTPEPGLPAGQQPNGKREEGVPRGQGGNGAWQAGRACREEAETVALLWGPRGGGRARCQDGKG